MKGLDNITEFKQVLETRKNMQAIAKRIRQGEWLSSTNKPITDVVNVGIGGSDLGPRLCAEALIPYKNTSIRCHFISDADQFAFGQTLAQLNPETTLFLISSKSFTTEETLRNAKLAQDWINHPQALAKQFIAITAAQDKAKDYGFTNILDIGSWVVGRYSSCSAINLMTAIQIGYEGYLEFIEGAHAMDQHFLQTPWQDNLPTIMALIGIWNINFLHIPSHLLLIYDSRLRLIMDYVQQLDMESNGKSVNRQGQSIPYATGPIIWGGLGNQAHHSYYQHLAQGQHQVAIDFINVAEQNNQLLNQLCQGRKKVLHQGWQSSEGMKFAIKQQTAIAHLQLNQLSPRSLGALIALYEHKIFTQAWLWNINPFDQPGVESAKQDFATYRQKLESS
jgi:glucose-6-phosphate isomerase